MNKELFLKLYKTLVRTHTDYGNSIWYPITKKNKQAIENLQRRATKIVPEIKDLSYEERLRELNLPRAGKIHSSARHGECLMLQDE